MVEKILFLGGPQWSVNTFKALKDLGFQIILTDLNPDCPCRPFADNYFQVSATDVEGILKAIKGIDSIIISYCGNDFGAQSSLRVNEQLYGDKLLDANPDIFIDKNKMKQFFQNHSIPTAKGEVLPTVPASIESLTFPKIFKPVDASGARGVRFVKDVDAARVYLEEHSQEYDRILVEEVLSGTQHDINGFFVDGNFYPAGISDRFFAPYPHCYPIYGYSPSLLSNSTLDACYASLEAIGRTAGLVTGPLKSDAFINKEGTVETIEVCIRFHGDITSTVILPNTGHWYPFLQYLSELAPQYRDDIKSYLLNRQFSKKQTVRWDIIETPPGKFASFDNFDELRMDPDVVDILVAKKTGEILGEIRDNRDVFGYLLTQGTDPLSCAATASGIKSRIRVMTDEK